MYCCTPKALYNHVGGGSLLNHHQCAASTWMMRRQPQDNGASALTTHQLQVERREVACTMVLRWKMLWRSTTKDSYHPEGGMLGPGVYWSRSKEKACRYPLNAGGEQLAILKLRKSGKSEKDWFSGSTLTENLVSAWLWHCFGSPELWNGIQKIRRGLCLWSKLDQSSRYYCKPKKLIEIFPALFWHLRF